MPEILPHISTSAKILENALKTAFSRIFLMFFRGFILAHIGSFCDKKVVKKLSKSCDFAQNSGLTRKRSDIWFYVVCKNQISEPQCTVFIRQVYNIFYTTYSQRLMI